MVKLIFAFVSLLSIVRFAFAAPIPAPASQGLIGDILGGTPPSGGSNGPNGTSESSDPLSGLLEGSSSQPGVSSNGPNGTPTPEPDPLTTLFGGGEDTSSNGPNGTVPDTDPVSEILNAVL